MAAGYWQFGSVASLDRRPACEGCRNVPRSRQGAKLLTNGGASVPRLQRSKGRWEVGHMNQIIREIKRQAAGDKLDQSGSWA